LQSPRAEIKGDQRQGTAALVAQQALTLITSTPAMNSIMKCTMDCLARLKALDDPMTNSLNGHTTPRGRSDQREEQFHLFWWK